MTAPLSKPGNCCSRFDSSKQNSLLCHKHGSSTVLPPTERVVFLLREAFELEYADIALVVDRSEENCRQILRRARERIADRETSSVPPTRWQNHRVVSEFLNAAETGQFEELLQLLSEGAVLAPAPRDLSQPAPPLIYDRKVLLETLGSALSQMRERSDGLAIFSVGQDYACVARSGRTAKAAILLRLVGEKVAAVRLVSCPALLHKLQILMAASLDDAQRDSDPRRN